MSTLLEIYVDKATLLGLLNTDNVAVPAHVLANLLKVDKEIVVGMAKAGKLDAAKMLPYPKRPVYQVKTALAILDSLLVTR